MSDLVFPWKAFLEAQKQANSQRGEWGDVIGKALAQAGQMVGQGRQAKFQQQGQRDFARALTPQPVQGPPNQAGQMPEQPQPDVGSLLSSFQRGYPNQPLPPVISDRLDPLKQAQTKYFLSRASGNTETTPAEEAQQMAALAGSPGAAQPFVTAALGQGRKGLSKQDVANMFKMISSKATTERGGYFSGMLGVRENQLTQSLVKDARDTLNPYFSKGAGQEQAKRLDSISRAEPLIQQMLSQPGGGDPRQMVELATTLNRVIQGGGATAEAQVQNLTPQTARGKFANWAEWFTNDPHGTQQQAFIRRYADTVQREKKAIMDRVEFQAQRNAPTLRVLKNVDPAAYRDILNSVLTQFSTAQPGVAQSNSGSQADPLGILGQ